MRWLAGDVPEWRGFFRALALYALAYLLVAGYINHFASEDSFGAYNDLLIDLAEIGLGIACIPDYMLRNRPGLEPVHLKTPLPARSAVIAHHEALQLSQAAQCFLKYFSQI